MSSVSTGNFIKTQKINLQSAIVYIGTLGDNKVSKMTDLTTDPDQKAKLDAIKQISSKITGYDITAIDIKKNKSFVDRVRAFFGLAPKKELLVDITDQNNKKHTIKISVAEATSLVEEFNNIDSELKALNKEVSSLFLKNVYEETSEILKNAKKLSENPKFALLDDSTQGAVNKLINKLEMIGSFPVILDELRIRSKVRMEDKIKCFKELQVIIATDEFKENTSVNTKNRFNELAKSIGDDVKNTMTALFEAEKNLQNSNEELNRLKLDFDNAETKAKNTPSEQATSNLQVLTNEFTVKYTNYQKKEKEFKNWMELLKINGIKIKFQEIADKI